MKYTIIAEAKNYEIKTFAKHTTNTHNFIRFDYSMLPTLNTYLQLTYITNFTHILTRQSRAVVKLTGSQQVKKFPIFMAPEGSISR